MPEGDQARRHLQRESDGAGCHGRTREGSNGKLFAKRCTARPRDRFSQLRRPRTPGTRHRTTGGNMTVSAWLDNGWRASTPQQVEGIYSRITGSRHLYVRPSRPHPPCTAHTRRRRERWAPLAKLEGAAHATARPHDPARALGQAERRAMSPQRRSSHRCPAVKGRTTVLTPEQASSCSTPCTTTGCCRLTWSRSTPVYVKESCWPSGGPMSTSKLALSRSPAHSIARSAAHRSEDRQVPPRRAAHHPGHGGPAASPGPQNLEGTQGSDDLVFTSTRGTALYESNIVSTGTG